MKRKNNLISSISRKTSSLTQLVCVFLVALSAFTLVLIAKTSYGADQADSQQSYEKKEDALSPIYSFWNIKYNYHFYTSSENEKAKISNDSNWRYEGIAWYAYATEQPGTVPVYRLSSSKYHYHYYTTSEQEKNKFLKTGGWKYDGVGWYAYSSEQAGNTPIYHLKNRKTQRHLFTSSPGEKNCLLNSNGGKTWQDRGIGWRVPIENANVSSDETMCAIALGPEIAVGLWSYTRDDLKNNPFKINANKDYRIKDKSGNVIAEIPAQTLTKIIYTGDKNLKIYGSISDKTTEKEVLLDAKDGDNSTLIFDIYRPSSPYDQYRGKIKLRYSDTSKEIWAINMLPLEQYAWGMGEITGTGPMEHSKLMTTIFRTYGNWYIENATKYAPYGFKIKSDSGSQIYRGYDWEMKYLNIKKAALATRGRIVTYKEEAALTPYSSWTDGRTRSFEERWGSKNYPWCQSVKDPYGKNSAMSTKELEAAGNHMVGVCANGSLKLADKYKWDYQKILKYYYTKIDISQAY